MTPEAHEIIKEMQRLLGVYKNASQQAMPPLTERMAALLVLIAEEQEKSAMKLERQTAILIRLTRILAVLTVGLFVLTVYLCYDSYKKDRSADLTHQRGPKQ